MNSREKFEIRKKRALTKLEKALDMGLVDLEVLPVINFINRYPNFYTTSSCAGRLVLMTKKDARAKHSTTFLFKTHDLKKFDVMTQYLPTQFNGQLWFSVTAPLFHIGVFSLNDAEQLVKLALEARLGYSMFKSVSPKIIVEIRGTGRIEVPIGENNAIFVNKEYLSYLIALGKKIIENERERLEVWIKKVQKAFGEY